MHDPARKVGATVFPELRKHFWRRAIGLVAAYAFLLQSFLALSMVTQAAAAGSLSHGGTFFVLCLNDDSAAKDDASAPIKPVTHCPACTLAVVSGAAPESAALPTQVSYIEQRTPFITAEACIAFHQARSGLTRAPPQNV
ncbi:MAG: hypothetical protein AB1490_16705 [Pseudomonadota bacterium]